MKSTSGNRSVAANKKLISAAPESGGDWYFNACVGNNTGSHDNSIGYSGGFQAAAEVMLMLLGVSKPDGSHENWGAYPLVDMLVYPICYCARHHVELALKRALPKAWMIFKMRSPNEAFGLSEPRQAEITHSVLEVWSQLHNICEKADSRLSILTMKLKPYIEEIDAIDNSGQTFRYALDAKDSTPHLEDFSHINLEYFANGYAELCVILEELELQLQVMPDEFSTGSFTSVLDRNQLFEIASRLPNRDEWSSSAFLEIKSEILKEYNLSSNDFQKACNTILKTRSLAHYVGVFLPIPGLSQDTFVRLRSISKNGLSDSALLSIEERSIILGLLRVGSPMFYPEEFESFLVPCPEDEDEAMHFEREREPCYLARKAANGPDLIVLALLKMGQNEILAEFRKIFKEEIENREKLLSRRTDIADFFQHNSRNANE